MARRPPESLRAPILAGLLAALTLALACPAQDVGTGSGGLGRVAGPRGSAVPSDDSGRGQGGQFGGLSGGQSRSSGGPGASSRNPMPTSPGDPTSSRLGPPLGASGATDFENARSTTLRFAGSRFGPSVLPGGNVDRGGGQGGQAGQQRQRIEQSRREVEQPRIDPITLSAADHLEIPPGLDDPGPPDGLTLDAAIGLLMTRNLDLMARRYEVPKAQADVLTASLRNNPILNADAQLVPYGHYSFQRPGGGGGQPQYDVNFSYPVDFTRKRKARIDVATRAKAVTEAQLQDSARNLIDDLYTAYVNALAARETLRFGEAFLSGITALLEKAEREAREATDDKEREEREDAVHALRDQANQARFQVRRSAQVYARTKRQLALILDLPAEEADRLELRGLLREPSPPAPPASELVGQALAYRPDLVAYRLGLGRARAEVGLARDERYQDIYVVYQPYTFQDNSSFGLKGTYSYAVGVNAALPIYNRNQGNIRRAEWNVRQTETEVRSRERQVIHDVEEAARSLELSAEGVGELEREVLPAARKARDDAFEQYRKDPSKVNEYIDKQQNYNDVVQDYRNALIEHRQNMLALNTAVGARVMP